MDPITSEYPWKVSDRYASTKKIQHHQYMSAVIPLHIFDDRFPRLIEVIQRALVEDIQIILVLDGISKTDQRFPDNLLSRNSNLHILEVNCKNPGGARNAGLEIATGKWVTFWDSDDLPNSEIVLSICKEAEKLNRHAAVGSFAEISINNGYEETHFHKFTQNSTFNLLKITRNPGIWRWAFRRELIGDLRFHSLRMGEDILFITEMGIKIRDIYFSNEIAYGYYKWSENQLTRTNRLNIKAGLLFKLHTSIQDISVRKKSLLSILLGLRILSFLAKEWCSKVNEK